MIEGLASAAATLLTLGMFFYTKERFGWGLRENFQLATVQGAVYVAGALSAQRLTSRLPHRTVLGLLYVGMALAAGVAAMLPGSPTAVTGVLLAYSFLSAVAWPILESLISTSGDPRAMARRIALYNIVWPATGAAMLAVSGTVIEHFRQGVFLIPATIHVLTATLCFLNKPLAASRSNPVENAHPQVAPEPELLRVRQLALWVSRLALPATYAVIYGLMPMLPFLLADQRFDTATQTLVGSVWLVARWLAFIALGMSAWWHTRPTILLAAAAVMLIAFLGIALPPSQLFASPVSPGTDLAALLLWQSLLGLALGVIYSGSLYFGMVLGDGSTEHGGYHEALIGLGWILGPAAGMIALWLRPGDMRAGVIAVGAVIGASVLTVAGACVVLRRRKPTVAD